MNKIIWVFGSCSSGKETFINNIINGECVNLINELGWSNKKIVAVEESIRYIKQYANDPIGEKRIEIIDKAINLNRDNDNSIILIKGQNVDLNSNSVNMLREKLPNLSYEIIFLFSDVNTIFERSKNKSWFVEEEEKIEDYSEHMRDSLDKVRMLKDIKIIPIDTTDGYKMAELPIYDD
jgi:hypothetical protein